MIRPVHGYAVGPGRRATMATALASLPSAMPAPIVDSFQRRRPSIAVLPFVDQTEDDGETKTTG